MDKRITAAILALLLITQANAARVGVVVQFPDGSAIQKGVEISENASGYDVANAAGASIEWDGPGAFGHSLCKINGVGNDISTCLGSLPDYKYWGYWIIKSGQSSWTPMPVGHDGGDACWNRNPSSWDGHYCATDGDIVGYVFGVWGAEINSTTKFTDIFPSGGGKGRAQDYYIGFAILPYANGTTALRIFDNATNKSIDDATVEVYPGTAGFTQKLFDVKTGRDGLAELELTAPKEYGLRITAYRYHQLYSTLDVTTTTLTTMTSTSTTTTTTMMETTTTMLKHFIYDTTTSSTTTTMEEPQIIGNAINTEQKSNDETDYIPYALALIIIGLPAVAWLRR